MWKYGLPYLVLQIKKTKEIIAKGCDIFHFKNERIAVKDTYRKVTTSKRAAI